MPLTSKNVYSPVLGVKGSRVQVPPSRLTEVLAGQGLAIQLVRPFIYSGRALLSQKRHTARNIAPTAPLAGPISSGSALV
jgi:hypothetical protein